LHIQRIIDDLDVSVTYETEHTGSPHKLTLNKTELLHAQATERFLQMKKALHHLQ
jgi:hypothetical protein